MPAAKIEKSTCPTGQSGQTPPSYGVLGDLAPRQGLPEDVFLLVSSVTPMVNVDLLVRDGEGRILLSWRDDPYSGVGWHVPGGIVRFKERLETRIQKTAKNELGTEVLYEPTPLACEELFREDDGARSHFISFIYDCQLSEGYEIPAANTPLQPGALAWHAVFPENMISIHGFYRRYFS